MSKNLTYSKNKVVYYLSHILFLLTFMQVAIVPFSLILYGVLFLTVLASLILIFIRKTIDKSISKFMLLYNLPFIFSLIISLPISYLYGNSTMNYEELNILGRLTNLMMFSIVIISIETNLNDYFSNLNYKRLFRYYWIGCMMLIFTGIWHAASIYLHIIPFPFDTRSHVHSVGKELAQNLGFRLTGIAQEPSYFVTYIVDCIILTCFLFKKGSRMIFLAIGLFILFLTFSPSGYLLLISSILLMMFIYMIKYFDISRVLKCIVFIALLILITFIIHIYNPDTFEYILLRVQNVEESGRYSSIITAINYIEEGNIFNLFFGYGLKSFSLIHNVTNINSQTSNNLFIDIFFECGIIGLLFLFYFYFYLFGKIYKCEYRRNFILGFMLYFDLLVSALFKADYAILRSFVLIYFIYILCVKQQQYKI